MPLACLCVLLYLSYFVNANIHSDRKWNLIGENFPLIVPLLLSSYFACVRICFKVSWWKQKKLHKFYFYWITFCSFYFFRVCDSKVDGRERKLFVYFCTNVFVASAKSLISDCTCILYMYFIPFAFFHARCSFQFDVLLQQQHWEFRPEYYASQWIVYVPIMRPHFQVKAIGRLCVLQ